MQTVSQEHPLLSVDELSVEFRTRHGVVTALHDVSLQVAKGEVLGVVGESGSGKSVTAYTVLGLLDAAGRSGHAGHAFELDVRAAEREQDGEDVVAGRIDVEDDPVRLHAHTCLLLISERLSAVSRMIFGRCR